MKSAPQHPLPLERATWVGEAVAAVVAESRAVAEDAVAKVIVDYEPLPAAVDMETALRSRRAGDPPRPRRQPLLPARQRERQGRRGVREPPTRSSRPPSTPAGTPASTLEPRSILADYNRASAKLTVYHSTQAPHMMQGVFAKQMRLPEGDVRVICTDVGGSYGIKVHVYPDEVATAVIAKMHGAPGQVHRRPAGELPHRHPRPRPPHHGPHGRGRRGPHHRHRHRRPDGHRPLFGLSAHQRGRRQPGGQPDRRPLRLRQLPRQDHGGVPEQDADLPVPRRRPPDRQRGDGRPGRPRRRGRWASIPSSSAAAT